MATGDEAALSQLYDRFSGQLYTLAIRILGDEGDAGEVVLDVFTHAWKKAHTYDGARSTVATWLSMMLRSRAIDRVRARRSRQKWIVAAQQSRPDQSPAMGQGPPGVLQQAERHERRRHIDAALQTLSPEQRRAIELAFFQGLSHSQIAKRLDTPLGTIKTRIRAGMRTLKDRLDPLYADESP